MNHDTTPPTRSRAVGFIVHRCSVTSRGIGHLRFAWTTTVAIRRVLPHSIDQSTQPIRFSKWSLPVAPTSPTMPPVPAANSTEAATNTSDLTVMTNLHPHPKGLHLPTPPTSCRCNERRLSYLTIWAASLHGRYQLGSYTAGSNCR